MVNLTEIFNKLISEHNLDSLSVKNFKISDQIVKDISVISKNNFDYIIFMELDFDSLKLVNNDIQINLATKFKDFLYDSDRKFEITQFFEKNTHLIIATQHPNEKLEKDIFKEISVVEEDFYFFKKQIFYYSDRELDSLKFNNLDLNLTVYLNEILSDISRYENYLKNGDDEYSFIIKLFQKFPFLKLEIQEKELLNLDKMLADSLSIEELDIIPELLEMTSDDSINNWIKSLGVKND